MQQVAAWKIGVMGISIRALVVPTLHFPCSCGQSDVSAVEKIRILPHRV